MHSLTPHQSCRVPSSTDSCHFHKSISRDLPASEGLQHCSCCHGRCTGSNVCNTPADTGSSVQYCVLTYHAELQATCWICCSKLYGTRLRGCTAGHSSPAPAEYCGGEPSRLLFLLMLAVLEVGTRNHMSCLAWLHACVCVILASAAAYLEGKKILCCSLDTCTTWGCHTKTLSVMV